MRRILFSLFMLLALLTGGCQYFNPIGPIIQLGIYWKEGEAHKYYATDQKTIYVALRNVLTEFNLPLVKEETEDNTIYLKAGDDDRFKIKVVAVRENVTKLSIRVNTFGDKPYAELIYRHVDQQPGVKQFATLEEINEAMDQRR